MGSESNSQNVKRLYTSNMGDQILADAARVAEYLRQQGVSTCPAAGWWWREYQRMAVPVGPVSWDFTVPPETARQLLRELPRCLLVRATAGLQEAITSWYAVVVERFVDLADCEAKVRSEIRRGLKHCQVRLISGRDQATQIARVEHAAFTRYKDRSRPDRAEVICERMRLAAEYADVIHLWGVFHGEALIAYAENYAFGKTEVFYSTIRLDPQQLALYPMYALVHEMNRHYLAQQGVARVIDGFRSILHPTSVQEFLVRKFGFRHAGVALQLHYRPWVGLLVKALVGLGAPYPFLPGAVNAVATQERLCRSARVEHGRAR